MKNNHAFFPLLTYIKSKIKMMIPFEMTELIIGIVLPYMLYKLTRTLYKSEPFAYYSSIFMALNFWSRFYISFYTEGLFSLISIVGFLFLFNGYTEDWISRVPYSKIIISSFLLSMAVFWRSNGLLLWIVPGIFILCKLYQSKTEIVKSLLITMLGILVLAIFIYPLMMITRVIPYNMYCSPSVDETALSAWWHLKYPDLYSYIQKTYWNSGFLQQFKRGFHSSYLESLPINLLNIFILKQIVLSFINKAGITPNKVVRPSDSDKNRKAYFYIALVQPATAWIFAHYIITIIFINLFANLEIMMRVSSTHPVHYWGIIYLQWIKIMLNI